jgi:excisionase family DNA binding protein
MVLPGLYLLRRAGAAGTILLCLRLHTTREVILTTTGDVRTISETALLLNLSPATIRSWVRSQKLGYTRLGRSIRIPASEIDRLLTDGYHPPLPTKEGQ